MKKNASNLILGIPRKAVKKVHLYLGIPFGLLVFIISISGALYVFKDEIQTWNRKEAMHLHGEYEHEPLELSELIDQVQRQMPENHPLSWIKIPMDQKKSYEFHFIQRDPSAWNYYDEFKINQTAYVDPYTGTILKIYDEKKDFFFLVLRLHFALLLGSSIGSWVVGTTTLIFLLMIISGIILWFPKNKKSLKQRFWFRWKNIKSWKRKNYDFHNILGFYSSFFSLIIAITGLFYAFKVVPVILYFIFSGGKTGDSVSIPEPQAIENITASARETSLNKIARDTRAIYPNAASYRIILRGKKKSTQTKSGLMKITVRQSDFSRYVSHELFFDRNNGDLLMNRPYQQKNFGEKLIGANYDIHVGSILGAFGKCAAFIISLVCASLPITGFMIWIGRTKNKKRHKA